MALTEIFSMYANCDLDLDDMTLNQGHDTIVCYIIKIQHDCEE